MFDPATIDQDLRQSDPLVQYWWNHLSSNPVNDNQRVLFLRRWLSRADGERPCPVQAACWLDIKRTYLEMRPHLRRVYLALRDLSMYAPVAVKLGFQPLAAETDLSGARYTSAMLDFGPASVDGWLARLGSAELGVEEGILDRQSHEIVLDGQRVKLTKLEFEVFAYLYQRQGTGVSRAALVEDVWGWKHTGSNVVEAVMRSLRKKLGERSESIETIRGLGYRFRNL
jgi:DNA-binding response OmpR family regulator